MNARKHEQRQLANDWALGKECVAVNDRVWFEDRDGVRVVCVRNTPFYTYDLNDRVQHLFCACQLIEAILAKQCEVVRTFGVSEGTVRNVLKEKGLYPRPQIPQPSLPFEETNHQEHSEDTKHSDAELSVCAEAGQGANEAVEATSIAYASPGNQLATILGLLKRPPWSSRRQETSRGRNSFRSSQSVEDLVRGLQRVCRRGRAGAGDI